MVQAPAAGLKATGCFFQRSTGALIRLVGFCNIVSSLVSTDPASGEPVGSVPVATRSSVTQAVESARSAQEAWAGTDVRDRVRVLQRFRRILARDRDELTALLTRENGKPRIESLMADLIPTLETAKHLERLAPRALAPSRFRLRNPLTMERTSSIERAPLGVVGIIAPWNFPLSIPATGALSALVAGNGVVLKPSEHTPLIAQAMVDRLHEAGVPEGLLRVVHGKGPVGAALAQSDVDGMVFTGSVATGQKVAAAANERCIPTLLELGGKDPALVLPGADAAATTRGISWGAFTNAGQACASVERCFVPTAEAADWQARFQVAADALRVGPGLEPDVEMGPVIDDAAVRRIRDHIQDAEKRGAHVIAGGDVLDELGPRFIAPTVIADADPSMTCMREETFGPTLPIMAADGEDAVAAANDCDYGLTASVWGPSKQAEPVAHRMEAGTVTINDCVYTFAAPETPWSGWKRSGNGTSHGPNALDAVTQIRHINRARHGRQSKWHHPYDEGLDDLMGGATGFLHGGGKEARRMLRGLRRR